MRLLLLLAALAATLIAQGGGSVQFRDWTPPPSTAKPVIACRQLLSQTGYDLSIMSAALTPATARRRSIAACSSWRSPRSTSK